MPAKKQQKNTNKPSSSGAKMVRSFKNRFRDWAESGHVNPVFDQKETSHCSIITAIAAVEALYMIKKNVKDIKLSEQELIDNYYLRYQNSIRNPLRKYCSNNKCFKYIENYGISMSEDWEIYTGNRANLTEPKQKPNPQIAISITGYTKVVGEESVLAALDRQPLAGAMYVTEEFMNLKRGEIYKGGNIISDCMHAVLLVIGFGTDNETRKKYYKIRGSWGPGWADDGYARVERQEVHRISYPNDIKTYME